MFYIVGDHIDGNTYLLGGNHDRRTAEREKQRIAQRSGEHYLRIRLTSN